MKITRVKAPKFRVGRYVLNEYELRTLMVEVAKGEKPGNIKVKCPQGMVSIIREDGILTDSLSGFDIAAKLCIELLTIKRGG